MKKILVSDKLAEAGINFLNEQPDIQVHIETGLSESALCECIVEYDALLIRSATQVTEKVLNAGTRLKVVGRAGIGVDNVDIGAATERGVIVMNTPDANATTTAELAIAHMLSLSRHLPRADHSVRSGKWERSKLMGTEVAHKTLAIISFGTIGRIASTRALGLGMRVIGYDPFVTPEVFESHGVEPKELDQLIAEADYLSLHCPRTERTRNILNAERIGKMKKGAHIINCARGGLIDETALYNALKSGHLAGAALDVYAQEPPRESPLLTLENVVFTPHLGASTREAQVAVSVEIARQVVTFFKTGEAINALNLPRLSSEDLHKLRPYLNLAHTLGRLLAHLATAPFENIEVALFGRAAEVKTRPVATEVLVGLLDEELSIPVNRVNVTNLAKRQGIALTESRSEETHDYLSLIRVTGCYDGESVVVAGTLLGECHPRLVQIDDYEIEAVPEGTLLITRHEDRPGVVAALGTVLGNENINISRMQTGVAPGLTDAIAVIGISSPLSPELLNAVCEIPAVHTAIQVTL
ncbi:MAG: phosphoglycerate dehydrogenase [Pseudomonadota bacterium]